MKILIIHNSYKSSQIGGEDLVVHNELQALTKKLGNNNVFSYSQSNDDIKIAKLLINIWGNKKVYRDVFNLVSKNKISIVHVHNFFPKLTPIVFLAAKRAGAKIVHTLHNYRWWCLSGLLYHNKVGNCTRCVNTTFSIPGVKLACYRNSRVQSLVAALSFGYYKLKDYYQYVDKFLVLSHDQQQTLLDLNLPSHKIALKPNFILPIKRQANPPEKQGFIFVGRIEQAKGVDLLLAAWQQLPKEYQLTIVGDGPLKQQLSQQYNATNIKFLGKLPNDQVINLISAAKYLIQPSVIKETFGLTILEALAVGTPVIGFNIGTRPEFINDSVNGFLCAPNTLIDVIKKANGYVDYKAMSDKAVLTANQYSETNIIDRQISIYQDLLQ